MLRNRVTWRNKWDVIRIFICFFKLIFIFKKKKQSSLCLLNRMNNFWRWQIVKARNRNVISKFHFMESFSNLHESVGRARKARSDSPGGELACRWGVKSWRKLYSRGINKKNKVKVERDCGKWGKIYKRWGRLRQEVWKSREVIGKTYDNLKRRSKRYKKVETR